MSKPPEAWSLDDLTITLEILQGSTAQIRVTTPAGDVRILCDAEFRGRDLHISGVHIEGLAPGLAGRKGLNLIGEKVREAYDVERIYVAGASRTTGANPNRPPRPFRYPR